MKDIVYTFNELAPFSHMRGKILGKGCRATVFYAPTDFTYGMARMMQIAIAMEHEIADELFIVVRSKEELENALTKIRS